jgi:serine phosphatase RsbU (regulator of sigma subunit)
MVYNQHEQALIDNTKQLTGAVLKGSIGDLTGYLAARRKLDLEGPGSIQRQKLTADMTKHLLSASKYYSLFTSGDPLYDVSFVIYQRMSGSSLRWEETARPRYIYFKRKSEGVEYQSMKDPLLSTSLYPRFMDHITISSALIFADDPTSKKKYVIMGYPLFGAKQDILLYKRYRLLEVSRKDRNADSRTLKKEERSLREIFIRRLTSRDRRFPFTITLARNDFSRLVFAYFWRQYRKTGITARQYSEIRDFFAGFFIEKVKDNRITSRDLYGLFEKTASRYRLTLRKNVSGRDFRDHLVYHLRKYRALLETDLTTEQLALMSYRGDLLGISGIFLHRHKFFESMDRKTSELVNLILAVFLRAVAIAIFFPGFLVRSVQKLASGARDIGRGNLDTVIDIGGSDEIAQLSDILNETAASLKEAARERERTIRMEGELKTAEALQKALLPEKFPRVKGYGFASYYAAQSESGGDYYDVIQVSDTTLALVMADVSGHGVGPGLVMAMTRTLLHTFIGEGLSLRMLLSRINSYLYGNTASHFFVSMFLGMLHTGTGELTYVSAGHLPSLVADQNRVRELKGGGIALGVVGPETFENLITLRRTTLKEGDTFLQLTDGVIEAMNSSGDEYGEERLKSVLSKAGMNPKGTVKLIVNDVNRFIGGEIQGDDITLLAVTRK